MGSRRTRHPVCCAGHGLSDMQPGGPSVGVLVHMADGRDAESSSAAQFGAVLLLHGSCQGIVHGLAARAALVGLLTLRQLGLGPHVEAVPKSAELAQFWATPAHVNRSDILAGPTSSDLRPPDTARPFAFISRKKSGFSPGYDVRDASGREWSVKLGPEAQSEVAVSRLLDRKSVV